MNIQQITKRDDILCDADLLILANVYRIDLNLFIFAKGDGHDLDLLKISGNRFN